MSGNGTSRLNGRTQASTSLTCPLCTGTGVIERREILRLAGMDGVVEAVGPCVTEWLNQTGGNFLDKVKRDAEAAVKKEYVLKIQEAKQSLEREHERAQQALSKEVERTKGALEREQEKREKLTEELALRRKSLEDVTTELQRLRNTATKKGEAGEVGFAELLASFEHVRLSAKLSDCGDYLVSIAIDDGSGKLTWLNNTVLVDVKDRCITAGDIRKAAADARARKIDVAFVVATTLRSKDPIYAVTHENGVLVVSATQADFLRTLSLVTPYVALRAGLTADSQTEGASARLAALTAAVVSKLMELAAVRRQTQMIAKAAQSIDVIVEAARKDIARICRDASAVVAA